MAYPTNDLKAFIDKGLQGVNLYINGATTPSITEASITSGGFVLDRYCSSAVALELGNVTAGQLSLILDTTLMSGSISKGDAITGEIYLKDDPSVSVKIGKFYVTSMVRGYNQLEITCLDGMIRLDDEASLADITFPIQAKDFLTKIYKTKLGNTLVIDDGIYNSTLYEPTLEEDLTYRQILSKVCECMGANAYFDWDGALHIGWYKKNSIATIGKDIRVNSLITQAPYKISKVEAVSKGYASVSIDGSDIVLRMVENPFLVNASTLERVEVAEAVLENIGNIEYYGGEAQVLPMPGLYPMDAVDFGTGLVPLTNVTIKLNANTTIKGEITTDSNSYNFGINKAIERAEQNANNYTDTKMASVSDELYDMGKLIASTAEDLQNQIDGNITTWYYAYAPTLTNKPASDWKTTDEKNNHIGDLFYNSKTGYAYRYMLDGTTYKWVRISDTDITEALKQAEKAQDTADSKRRVFIAEPKTPYDVGDLWTQGETGEILTCVQARTSSESFLNTDWKKLNKYTDDTALAQFISEDFYTLKGQVDRKAETYYQATDPAISWTTQEEINEHVGDLWYNTTNNTTWRYSASGWTQQNVPNDVFDKIDGKAQIFIAQPTVPYFTGDLWFNSESDDILTCVVDRQTGSFNKDDWKKRNKYTDDSLAKEALTLAEKIEGAIELIVGTQTAATGAWTGKASFSTLTDGQSIIYWLPYAGSGSATLNLTLSDGKTTGAKNIYYGSTTRLTTHYPAGSAIRMVYRKSAKIGDNTYEGWWCDANYDSNNYDRIRYNWAITAASAVTAGRIIVSDANGKYNLQLL